MNHRKTAFVCTLTLMTFTVGAAAQGRGGSTPPASGSGLGSPSSARPSMDTSSLSATVGIGQQGLYGRVMPAPSTRLEVDLYRDGQRIDYTMTDSEGNFQFQVSFNERRYEIRIPLGPESEYREDVDFLPGAAALIHINNQAKIRARPAANASGGTTVSLLTLAAPKKAVEELEKARAAARDSKFDEAMPHVDKAIELYPKFAEAYNDRGLIERRQNRLEDAEKSFRKAMELDPHWISPYTTLATILMNKSACPETLKVTTEVLKLDPSLGPMHYFSAVCYDSAGNLVEAEKEGLAAEKTDRTHNPHIQMVLGRIYEEAGKTADAVARYKKFIEMTPGTPDAVQLTAHVAQLEKK
jgi:Flp pilus assembly protein TadD